MVPFNSLSTGAFDEGEGFRIVESNAELGEEILGGEGLPLNDHAKSCAQGMSDDIAWDCHGVNISNVVCGHEGMVSFSSPEYEVWEVSVRREGFSIDSLIFESKINLTSIHLIFYRTPVQFE